MREGDREEQDGGAGRTGEVGRSYSPTQGSSFNPPKVLPLYCPFPRWCLEIKFI